MLRVSNDKERKMMYDIKFGESHSRFKWIFSIEHTNRVNTKFKLFIVSRFEFIKSSINGYLESIFQK